MAWTFERGLGGLLIVRVNGPYSVEMGPDLLRDLRAEAGGGDLGRMLIDYRDADVQMGTMDLYDRPDLYDQFKIDHRSQVALVLARLGENERFFENVCWNRGFRFRVFEDERLALEWLQGGAAAD